jgi:hypothetical protein
LGKVLHILDAIYWLSLLDYDRDSDRRSISRYFSDNNFRAKSDYYALRISSASRLMSAVSLLTSAGIPLEARRIIVAPSEKALIENEDVLEWLKAKLNHAPQDFDTVFIFTESPESYGAHANMLTETGHTVSFLNSRNTRAFPVDDQALLTRDSNQELFEKELSFVKHDETVNMNNLELRTENEIKRTLKFTHFSIHVRPNWEPTDKSDLSFFISKNSPKASQTEPGPTGPHEAAAEQGVAQLQLGKPDRSTAFVKLEKLQSKLDKLKLQLETDKEASAGLEQLIRRNLATESKLDYELKILRDHDSWNSSFVEIFGDDIADSCWRTGFEPLGLASALRSIMMDNSLDLVQVFCLLGLVIDEWESRVISDPLASLDGLLQKMSKAKPKTLSDALVANTSEFESRISKNESDRTLRIDGLESGISQLLAEIAKSKEKKLAHLTKIEAGEKAISALDEELNKATRALLRSIGILVTEDSHSNLAVAEILDMTLPFNPFEVDELTSFLTENPSAVTLLRVLLARELNDWTVSKIHCCDQKKSSCNCGEIQKSKAQVGHRFGINWGDWVALIEDRSDLSWPLMGAGPAKLLRDYARYWVKSRSSILVHLIDGMVSPKIGLDRSVIEGRFGRLRRLNNQELADLNIQMVNKYGVSRSELAEDLKKQFRIFNSRENDDVTFWI